MYMYTNSWTRGPLIASPCNHESPLNIVQDIAKTVINHSFQLHMSHW